MTVSDSVRPWLAFGITLPLAWTVFEFCAGVSGLAAQPALARFLTLEAALAASFFLPWTLNSLGVLNWSPGRHALEAVLRALSGGLIVTIVSCLAAGAFDSWSSGVRERARECASLRVAEDARIAADREAPVAGTREFLEACADTRWLLGLDQARRPEPDIEDKFAFDHRLPPDLQDYVLR